MAETIKFLVTFFFALLLGVNSHATGVFEQSSGNTPKWSRYYLKMGRANGDFGSSSESFSVNYLGYKKMRGKFAYGAELGYLYAAGNKITTAAATMSLRPDWDLEVEPSLDLGFGTADLSGSTSDKSGNGTIASFGFSIDLIKGPFFSTTLGYSNSSLKTNATSVKSSSIQSVTFTVNIDLY